MIQVGSMHIQGKKYNRKGQYLDKPGSWNKQESSRKTSISAFLTMPKPLTVWITTKCGKVLKRWEYQTTWPASWEGTVRTGHGKTDWFQIAKGVHQGCILSPCLFNFYAEYIMRHAGLDEAQAESRLPGEISITSYMQMTPPLWQKVKRNSKASWWSDGSGCHDLRFLNVEL